MVVAYIVLNCIPALIIQFLLNILFLVYTKLSKKRNAVKIRNLILVNTIIGIGIIDIFPIVIGDGAYPYINTLFNLDLLFKTINISTVLMTAIFFALLTIFFLIKSYSVKLILILNLLISILVEFIRYLGRYTPSNLIYIALSILVSIITILVYKLIINRK